MITSEFVEGWTERINDTLSNEGVVVNLSGMTVQLQLWDKRKVVQTISGSVGIETAASGLVYFDPASTDLKQSKSPYMARWKVTDGIGQIAYFPSGAPNRWYVRQP
jgi:hypothetical protein